VVFIFVFLRGSGIPVLLNTSFNVIGEPIVESSIGAISMFFLNWVDYLVLGNYVVRKKMEDFCGDGSFLNQTIYRLSEYTL
jgi:predicted NodU family carbamoyl transferase